MALDSRRRSTAQPAPDSHGSVRSGIPVPASVKKQNSTLRMSLAGPALRAPHPPPSSGPGSNPRQSIMRSQNTNPNPLLQSTTKPNYGRTPLNNSTRRGSIWNGGAAVPPPGSQTAKDPRPLRDRAFQTQMKQEIAAYLKGGVCEIAQATLNNIQGKDYRAIFDFLVSTLDPYHPLNSNMRFEDEFVPALKALRYPFVQGIDNKWLAAPASMHSWPALLGVLHWLVEACKARALYETSGDPTLQIPSGIPEEFDDPWDHQALAFDYYEQAYNVWLDMVDDFVEPNQNLEGRYGRKNEQAQMDLEEKTNQLEQSTIELRKLKSTAPPVAKLQDENGLLKGDSEKFQKILHQYDLRKKKLTDQIATEKAELVTRGNQLEQLKTEQLKLAEIVKTQNLSPEEVIKMNTDHETLSQNLKDLKQKIAETHRNVMTLEVNVTNRAAAAEEAIDVYTNLLNSLGLFPPLAPPLQDVDLTLELNTASSNPQTLLSGADIRRVIKPTLSAVAESKRSERASVESERIKVDNELDQLTLECENVDEEIGEVEKKVVGLNDEADDLRDVAQQEAVVANSEAERLERDLAHARTAALANGMGVKSRLQALQFDYQEQVAKVSRLKEETVRAILKNSHDIAMFKEEVSRYLTDLRAFAESE
ncbi:HEC/Ndc80p family-domain-containing protein [Mycena rosella]|uniref:Kinetochore protein NDC80 n=1 Tax=Mycena rosella TaxID=1033263 RepID=A0AAD7GJT2_MYCRO|nr:HEC/Ndc80p family-domain-containing protein [Mycena rosella]